MIHRLRTRDLFAFSGEIILSGERRAQLQLGGAQGSELVKQQLVELLRQRYASVTATSTGESKMSPTMATGKSLYIAVNRSYLIYTCLLRI